MLSFVFQEIIEKAIQKNCLKNAIFWLKLAKWLKVELLPTCLTELLIKVSTKNSSPEKYLAMNALLDFGAKADSSSHIAFYSTPLEAAVRSLDLEATKILVDAGGNAYNALIFALNFEPCEGRPESNGSVVYYSVQDHSVHLSIVEYLLGELKDKVVLRADRKIATAVFEAVVNRNYKIAELLLGVGFEIDTQLEFLDVSALFRAYRLQNKRIARWYFDHGARECYGFYNPMTEWLKVND